MKNPKRSAKKKNFSAKNISLDEFKKVFLELHQESTKQILEQLNLLRDELSDKPTRAEFENLKKIQSFHPRQQRSLSVIKIGLN